MGCFVHSGVTKHVTMNSRRPDQPTEGFVNCFCNIVHLVSLVFLLPCSSVLVIVSAERKKQRSISNPIKNKRPDSQSHLLSTGIVIMLSQLPIVQFPPDQPSKARAPGDWYCHLAECCQREPCVHHGWNTPVVMTTQRVIDRCMS